MGIALSLPVVQTSIAKYVMTTVNKDFGTDITIDEVAISPFGGVKFKNVLIRDHHQDTLIYTGRIKTSILDGKKLLDGDLIFSDLHLDEVLFNLKTYKKEKLTNIDVFINAFGQGKPSKKHFLLTAKDAQITKGHFILTDENRVVPKDVDFTKLNIQLSDFKLYGPDVNTNILKMSFLDHRGVYVKKLSGIFSYTKKQIKLTKLEALTKENSEIKANVALNYKIEDFADFNNKVQFDVQLASSTLASNDIRCFYKELGKNQFFYTKANLLGTLNNLKVSQLNLVDSKKSKMIGAIRFKNLFHRNGQEFYMKGKFSTLSSSYEDLVTLLPNVLGKTLPTNLKKLGKFNLVGKTELTTKDIDANFTMTTALGNVKSNFVMHSIDFIDKASYVGNVVLDNFDLGTFVSEKDLGKISLNLAIDGIGFTEKYLNTQIKGAISQMDYNNYSYHNLEVNGNFKMPIYQGKVSINDPNLNLSFDGLVDWTKKDSRFDFHIGIANANLYQLKFANDATSLLKGDIVVQVAGNTIDNLQGDVFVNQTTYTNSKSTYFFTNFKVNSSFDENKIRTITVNSPDIVEGKIEGKYKFNQLRKLVENSLGSLYTNYKPNKVEKGQFLNFDFSINNKIVEVLFPEISIETNTVVKGKINSDKNEFKLNFNSPQIIAAKNTFDNVRINVDNKNPLYNAYIELDSIKSKYYKIRDFSLINVTMKDSLFFRTEFKGGAKGEDYFNLNLYHTINKDKKNVVGISKSEVKFKDYLWFLNENDTPDNRIVFDKGLREFAIEDIVLSHEHQRIELLGMIRGNSYKDLKLNFKDVNLNKITPEDELFVFDGNINGSVNFKQDKAVYRPTASLVIDHLNLNKTNLGTLELDIEGDESLSKFAINSAIIDNDFESFNASGNLIVQNNETLLDLRLKLDQFKLATLDPIGGEVLSNIRGMVSGNATVQGNINKPEINGRLYLDKAGMSVPYLGVDYFLMDKTIVDLTDEKFLFRNNLLTDSKFATKGVLNGTIEHNNFSDWKLDLGISSKRLLALDTKDTEDAAYFGTAFINGVATIKGPTNSLFINVDAKSEKGTSIKIPINNAESVSDNVFLHFITPREKFNLQKGIVEKVRDYNGLELEFDFNITPDAEVEVILDRNSGHGMKGKGNGSLLFKINTLGKFNMWGDFQAYEGTYNFRTTGINKRFSVKKGGSISWDGNPLKAQLNLEAVYKTTANPSLLIDNSSFNKKVPVEVVIGIKGDLMSPEPDFNIDFPTVTSVLKSEIQTKLYDKEVRQTQALYLLSTGSFLSAEGMSQSDLSGSLFETATGLLGNVIKSEDEKFNLGINVVGADRRLGKETDGRFEASISSKINERITFNGKLGVPFGGLNQTAFIGNVELLWRVNDDGTLNLRFFNKENDINYIGQGIGYTQGAGITYEVDFDTFKELVQKIFKKQRIIQTIPAEYLDQDSEMAPDFIRFSNSKKSNKEVPKKNQEAVIPEED
ncbi:translocation/assembly module TamB domain-containing protein [Flavobacterium sp.]|uniref:translocation/assembly module TamB domain-containing protein n=1 Tax=Flavobacterium sp. TaxID=239 RepID=UPI0025F35F77|nr:translocation/assembly module TamB domain-containing protein [Flavobacterium sp.]